MITDSYLAADGIENVIRVLEDLEDEKFARLQFIELTPAAAAVSAVSSMLRTLMWPKQDQTTKQVSSGR